jgi:hypothetical protein
VNPPPTGVIVLDVIKPLMKQAISYFTLEYWYRFNNPVYEPGLAGKHVELLFTALQAEPNAWRGTCALKTGFKWLEQDKKVLCKDMQLTR